MARGINKVILVGNLGNDPDTKYTQAGMAITRISLATTSMRKDRDGNNQERTEWHRVVFFGKLGEIAGEYLRKGSQVYVEGELRYDKYTGQDGVEKYTTDIVCDEMQMLGGKDRDSGGQQHGNQRQQGNGNQQQRRGNASNQRQHENGGQRGNGNGNGNGGGGGGGGGYGPRQGRSNHQPMNQNEHSDMLDDDIPFLVLDSMF
ncbi:single-stranded DNA-binding protein (plasmid) [Xanthomonas citri]|uniref:single-stranded DNA-binding protein n=1 Tax=Xanthomonas citri TaxID=346 RepID=UPI001C631E60|nr:single-stranded DNA-binding protein [Xanthomonas citri]QYF47500.1 single-stranded DNA-binding protein [Xanthomonas citri]